MQVHALPILGGPIGGKVKVGVIGNGWWWSATKKGYSDAQIAAYITPGVKAVSDVIASDTYQMTATSEEAAPKIIRMGAWARRVGGVKALGIGEFNAATASAITNAVKALAADPLYAWGCLWNADLSTVTALSGARLTAFRPPWPAGSRSDPQPVPHRTFPRKRFWSATYLTIGHKSGR